MTKKVNETNEAVNEKVNKPIDKSIKLEIVKNLGNYETVRLGIEIELNGSNAKRAFRAAKKKLDYSFEKLFSNENNLLKPNLNNVNNPTPVNNVNSTPVNNSSVNNSSINNVKKLRRFPQPETSEFQQLVKAVKNKLIEIEEVVHNYDISKEEFSYFKKCIDY